MKFLLLSTFILSTVPLTATITDPLSQADTQQFEHVDYKEMDNYLLNKSTFNGQMIYEKFVCTPVNQSDDSKRVRYESWEALDKNMVIEDQNGTWKLVEAYVLVDSNEIEGIYQLD